jgi:DNA-binding IclR family transcriptional regulator
MATLLPPLERATMNSLEAAMRVLKLLDKRRPVLRVGEISRELSLQKSTVSRLLRTLSEHEFLERESEGQGYTVGRHPLVLSDLYLAGHTLLERIDAVLDTLVDEFGFVGYAGVLSGGDIVVLRLKYGRYPLRFVQDVGQRIPAERTAIGRALLARKPDAEASALIAQPGSRAARATLLEELARIRRKGWAAIESAIIPGIAAAGAAVGDPARNEALGFALSFPMTASDELLRGRMARTVRDEARRLGQQLGDPFWAGLKASGEIAVAQGSRTGPRRARKAQRAIA